MCGVSVASVETTGSVFVLHQVVSLSCGEVGTRISSSSGDSECLTVMFSGKGEGLNWSLCFGSRLHY